MKKTILGLAVLGLLIGQSANASKYLKKPITGFTSNGVVTMGTNPDAPIVITGMTAESDGDLISTGNAGTNGTSIVATEYGDGHNHVTKLQLDSVSLGTLDTDSGANHNGTLSTALYTFPTNGISLIKAVRFNVALLTTNGNLKTDTPDIGIGTNGAAGSFALLSLVNNGESVLTGQTAADVNGTASTVTSAGVDYIAEVNSNNDLHLNVADQFAAADNGATVTANGSILIDWVNLDNG